MKKFVLALSSLIIVAGGIGCIKDTDCKNKTVESEQAAILAYASANSIVGTSHSSGIYYEVISAGAGPTPTLSSKVFVTYVGKLLDGTQFDAGTTPAADPWILSSLIQGWQIGLPLIQKGGRIKLIIPSSLAYGCAGKLTIPGNAILYFDITLNDVQ